MADYPMMYRMMFNAQTDAIEDLQAVTKRLIRRHQEVEELYINASEPELVDLSSRRPETDEKDELSTLPSPHRQELFSG